MRKINSIKQLKAEKMRLQQKRNELESAIQQDWRGLKESLRPRNSFGAFFKKVFEKSESETNGKNYFAEGLSSLATAFIRRMAAKAKKKFQ